MPIGWERSLPRTFMSNSSFRAFRIFMRRLLRKTGAKSHDIAQKARADFREAVAEFGSVRERESREYISHKIEVENLQRENRQRNRGEHRQPDHQDNRGVPVWLPGAAGHVCRHADRRQERESKDHRRCPPADEPDGEDLQSRGA